MLSFKREGGGKQEEVKRERSRNRALVAIAKANQKMSVRLAAIILSSSTLISALL